MVTDRPADVRLWMTGSATSTILLKVGCAALTIWYMSKEPQEERDPVRLTDEQRETLAFWAPQTLEQLDRSREEWEKKKREREYEEWVKGVIRVLTEEGIRAREREAEWERRKSSNLALWKMKPASPRIQ